MPTQAQAIEIIKRNYRAYVRRKRSCEALPADVTRLPDNFLVSRLQRLDFFCRTQAGAVTLAAGLQRGNYQLLEFYLQKGIDPRPMLYDAYFIRKSISQNILELASEVKNTVDELSRMSVPGNHVRIFSLLSPEAQVYLLPFLKRLYPLHDEEIFLLTEKFADVPLGERFFATVDLNDYYRLGSLKMIIRRALNQIAAREQVALHMTIWKHKNLLSMPDVPFAAALKKIAESVNRIKHDLFTFILPMHEVENTLTLVYHELLAIHPFLQRIEWNSSIYFQVMYANVGISTHVKSPNSHSVAQIIVSPGVLEICHEIIYGKNNHVGRLTGFGIFDPHCIMEATRAHNRIINIYSSHIKFAMEAHGSRAGSSSLRIHDINHWIRMNATPVPIRNGIIEWARMLEAETGMVLSRLGYSFYDMDITGYEGIRNDSSYTTSICFNMIKLARFYHRIIRGFNDLRPQLLDYHLLLFYGMLKNPLWMNRTFSHCAETHPQMHLDVFLHKFNEAFGINEVRQKEIRNNYRSDLSITHNVFHSILWDRLVGDKISLPVINILFMHMLPQINILKWQRNKGLQIRFDTLSFMARDITDDLVIRLISAILANVNAQQKNLIVKGITQLVETHEVASTVESAFLMALKKLLPVVRNPYVDFLKMLGMFQLKKNPPIAAVSAPASSVTRRNQT